MKMEFLNFIKLNLIYQKNYKTNNFKTELRFLFYKPAILTVFIIKYKSHFYVIFEFWII